MLHRAAHDLIKIEQEPYYRLLGSKLFIEELDHWMTRKFSY